MCIRDRFEYGAYYKFSTWLVDLLPKGQTFGKMLGMWRAEMQATTLNTTALTTRLASLKVSMFEVQFTAGALASRLTLSRLAALGASTAMGVLRGAIAGVNTVAMAFGGWVNILLTVGALFATDWLVNWSTSVDGATTAMDEHDRIMSCLLYTSDAADE